MAMPGVRRATAPPLRCDAGFTIIEMLVVLTILGLAMAVTPAILAGLDNNRLRAASLELVASMREARGRGDTGGDGDGAAPGPGHAGPSVSRPARRPSPFRPWSTGSR